MQTGVTGLADEVDAWFVSSAVEASVDKSVTQSVGALEEHGLDAADEAPGGVVREQREPVQHPISLVAISPCRLRGDLTTLRVA